MVVGLKVLEAQSKSDKKGDTSGEMKEKGKGRKEDTTGERGLLKKKRKEDLDAMTEEESQDAEDGKPPTQAEARDIRG